MSFGFIFDGTYHCHTSCYFLTLWYSDCFCLSLAQHRNTSNTSASRDAQRVPTVMRQESTRPSRRSRLRPRYRRHQTPTTRLIQAVQALIVQSRLVLERVERSLPLDPSSSPSSSSNLPSTSSELRRSSPTVEAPEHTYHPPPGLGPGATIAYIRGVHDAYRILAPSSWPTFPNALRQTASDARTRSSQDQRPTSAEGLASLYGEFLELIQTPTPLVPDRP